VKWARPEAARFEAWLVRVRESIIEVNDGIVAAAGVAEGFASVGASSHTVLLAGTSVTLAGGLAAAGVRYTEARTEWEMNRAQIDAERASILADPEGELAELAGIYEAKGLDAQLARQVARALTDRDPVAAHTDAELRLDALGPTSGALPAAATAGLSYGVGALLPLIAMYLLPLGERMPITFLIVLVALGLTGWFAARLTDLPAIRLIRRNVLLGAATMVIGILIGKTVGL
jgi:VIT1/CCC1 family predicted Fe2+/Mn2+ transporter